MKVQKKVFSLVMAFILATTSVCPAYAQSPTEVVPGVETVSTVYSSVESVIDWMNNIYADYQEKKEVEETQVRIERRQIRNEVKEIQVSLDPVKSVPLYNQLDYPDVRYGCCGTVASHGCGITSLAMVASYLLDKEILPDEMAVQFGEYNTDEGSYWILFEDSAEELGLGFQKRTENTNKVMEALRNGQVVVSLQHPGLFTGGGHFIVLVGLTSDGKIIVNDPNGANYTKNNTMIEGFTNGFTPSQVFQDGVQYWIYDKKTPNTNIEIQKDESATRNIINENTLVLSMN